MGSGSCDIAGNTERKTGRKTAWLLATTLSTVLDALSVKIRIFKEARGKGMNEFAIEFHEPKSLLLKAAWAMLEAANKGLFCQMITIHCLKNITS